MTKFEEEFNNCLHFGFIPNEQQNKIIEHFKDWQPQQPHQALPVVPEYVAEWIEYVKGKDNNATALLTDFDNMPEDVDEWLFLQSNDDNINLILRAWLDGYTVEKQQLFYLKHIDMSKSDAHLNWYLAKGTDNVLLHQGIKKGKSPKLKCILKLTQQEIDSMQTGSYEQIEVTE